MQIELQLSSLNRMPSSVRLAPTDSIRYLKAKKGYYSCLGVFRKRSRVVSHAESEKPLE